MKAQIVFLLCLVSISLSAQRVVLDVKQDYIPSITHQGDTLISSIPYGNHWVLDGVLLDGEVNQKLLLSTSGTYQVFATDFKSGCTSYSDPFVYVLNGLQTLFGKDLSLSIYPNPNKGWFIVTIETDLLETVTLELLSIDGKILAEKKILQKPGKQDIQFGKSNLSSGVYTVRINSGSKRIIRKLIVK